MDFPPQKFREMVFQLLFSLDMGGELESAFFMRALSVSKKQVRASLEKALAIWLVHEQLDQQIALHSHSYSFERIKRVEKNVLRLALYELLIEKRLNAKIIISEAHRLTRKFSTIEGASFVNALVETIDQAHESLLTLSPSGTETS